MHAWLGSVTAVALSGVSQIRIVASRRSLFALAQQIRLVAWRLHVGFHRIATYGMFSLQLLLALLFFWNPRIFFFFLPAHESFVRSVLPWHILAGNVNHLPFQRTHALMLWLILIVCIRSGLAIYLSAIAAMVTGVLNRQWYVQILSISLELVHDRLSILSSRLYQVVLGGQPVPVDVDVHGSMYTVSNMLALSILAVGWTVYYLHRKRYAAFALWMNQPSVLRACR